MINLLREINQVILESLLEEKCRIPLQMQIIGRDQFIGAEIKERKKERKKGANNGNLHKSHKIMEVFQFEFILPQFCDF